MTIELAPAMIEKACEAITRSNFWEFIDRTMTLELAVASAKYDGERAPNQSSPQGDQSDAEGRLRSSYASFR